MMSGIAPLETARESFSHDIERENAAIVDADENDIRLQEELAELGIEEGRLDRLQAQRDRLTEVINGALEFPFQLSFEEHNEPFPRQSGGKFEEFISRVN